MTSPTDPASEGPAAPPRASDADRHAAVRVLQDAVARGLLTVDEGSERMAAAFAARHRHELPSLTADLPPAPVPAAPAPGWRPLGSLAVARTQASVAWLLADGLRSRRALTAFAGVLAVLLLVLVLTAGLGGHHVGPHGHGGS
jgi:hypothetical protein